MLLMTYGVLIYKEIYEADFQLQMEFIQVKPNLVSRYNGGSFISSKDFYLYIFGGMSVSGPLNDLWRFQVDGFLWTQIVTSGGIPSPRLKFGYCSFTQNNILKFAVFGGLTMKGDDNNLFL
ncbi:unnamed protein product [Blepharisma stoltei]|uniref:Uncharacterized protein n=1 Tax=Blepharisma stoltei TaxID=1481888 RepID=A0AAU9J7G0_9CILI|nr:unnamed protein product [Blepharisma stoltei]